MAYFIVLALRGIVSIVCSVGLSKGVRSFIKQDLRLGKLLPDPDL